MQSAWCALMQDIELTQQDQDFGFQPTPRLEAVARHADEKEGNCNHATIMFSFATDRESSGRSFRKRQTWVMDPPLARNWVLEKKAIAVQGADIWCFAL